MVVGGGDVSGLKTLALLAVVAGHSLVWTTDSTGAAASTLDVAPHVWWVTWLLQVLPLFFVLSTAGMRRLAESADGRALAGRVALLVAPALPLYVMALVAVSIVAAVAPQQAHTAGVLAVQLTWFIGVYVLLQSAAPLIVRTTDRGLFAWLAVIVGTDVVRATALPIAGWLNMFAVWAAFMLIGLRLDRLRAVPTATRAAGVVAALAIAALLIWRGPYSQSLVSTPALPGLSNMAPPTLVLLFFGIAQTLLMVSLQPWIERALQTPLIDRTLSSLTRRAMQVYLYHLLIIGMLATLTVAAGITPATLSPTWWAVHVAVFAAAVALVFWAAPALQRAAGGVLALLTRVVPSGPPPSKPVATAVSLVIGVAVIVLAGRGVDAPLEPRGGIALGIPPLAAVAVIAGATAYLATRSARSSSGS